MAIRQRALDKLTAIQKDLHGVAKTGSKTTIDTLLKAMAEVRSLCQKGLPENRYADCGELFDGLTLAFTQLAAGSITGGNKEIHSLSFVLLQALIDIIRSEDGFKKEIVFLPYKASMWDSLESVWRAAYEDKDHCLTYVVPIPYADLTPEHTAAEWHCEKDMFPRDVPVLDWQTINLEAMHPDVIFIHNPYDQNNLVTSVESRYYSSKLREQTDKLIYIPYFVLAEPEFEGKSDEEIEKMEEGIEGFITTPAVLNAHQVIVQSEAMRRVYIDVLTRRTNVKDRAFWEKRILGLGSPKFDKVLNSKKEDYPLPAAWAKIVKNRKVILYNTSLTAMLQHTDKVCDKLRYVFSVFRDRKDVALWWRPHPLMKATLHSMRPQIAAEYEAIEREYIKAGWGIFDDTGNLHRAICWSDAYYGDGSSVVQLYEKTQKPMMFENMELTEIDDDEAVS